MFSIFGGVDGCLGKRLNASHLDGRSPSTEALNSKKNAPKSGTLDPEPYTSCRPIADAAPNKVEGQLSDAAPSKVEGRLALAEDSGCVCSKGFRFNPFCGSKG